jgi:hypothetical protein
MNGRIEDWAVFISELPSLRFTSLLTMDLSLRERLIDAQYNGNLNETMGEDTETDEDIEIDEDVEEIEELEEEVDDAEINVDMSQYNMITPEEFQLLLEKSPNLQSLRISGTNLTRFASRLITIQLNHLVELDLGWCKELNDEDLEVLLKKFCTTLKKLDLAMATIKGTVFLSNHIYFNELLELNLSGCEKIPEAALEALLKKCPNLQKLILPTTLFTGEALGADTSPLNRLITLDLPSNNKMREEHLKAALKKCHALQYLDLTDTLINGSAFTPEETRFDSLKKVTLLFCVNLTDENLQCLLEKSPNLQSINLGSTKITGKAFCSQDFKLDHLRELDLSFCGNLTAAGLMALLEKCPNLQKLDLRGTTISGPFISTGTRLNRLIDLNLSSKHLTDESLQPLLEKCPNVQTLDLEDCSMTGKVFTQPSVQLTSLIELNLKNCHHVTDENFKAIIEKCQQLRLLNLLNTPIVDPFSSPTVRLDKLQKITFPNNAEFDDAILGKWISNLPSLQILNLIGLSISGAAFTSEALNLNCLSKMHISKCVNLTTDNLMTLLEKIPNITILSLEKLNVSSEIFSSETLRLEHLQKINVDECAQMKEENLLTFRQRWPFCQLSAMSASSFLWMNK